MTALVGTVMTGGYGGADILKGCRISVESGEIAVIVGPNGAGKSTAMKAMFGMLYLQGVCDVCPCVTETSSTILDTCATSLHFAFIISAL